MKRPAQIQPRGSTPAAEEGAIDHARRRGAFRTARLCSVPVSSCISIISLIGITNRSTGHVRRRPVAANKKKLTLCTLLTANCALRGALSAVKHVARCSTSAQPHPGQQCSHLLCDGEHCDTLHAAPRCSRLSRTAKTLHHSKLLKL